MAFRQLLRQLLRRVPLLSRFARRLSTASRSVAAAWERQRVVRHGKAHFQRGLYWWSPDRRMVVRVGSTAPRNLVERRSLGPVPRVLVRLLTPPFLWNREGTLKGPECATVGNGREALYFDLQRGQVIRPVLHSCDLAEYKQMRDQLQEVLPGPDFSVDIGRRIVRDRFVVGRRLSELDDASQLGAAERILDAMEPLAHPRHNASTTEFFSLRGMQAPIVTALAEIKTSVGAGDLFDAARRWPVVPAHTDLWTGNVLVGDVGVYIVDWTPGRVGLAPFWYDALTLLLMNAVWPPDQPRPGLAHSFFQGHFDQKLDTLFEAAGAEPFDWYRERLVLVYLWSITRSYIRRDWKSVRPAQDVRADLDVPRRLASIGAQQAIANEAHGPHPHCE